MLEPFTGLKVIEVSSTSINKFYKDKILDLETKEYPNLFLVVKSDGQQSALAKVDSSGMVAELVSDKITVGSLKARNKEQHLALSALMDKTIPVNVMTGKAGTGKSILSIAAGLHLVEKGVYKKLILTRPMSQVGENTIGFLPGEVSEKFMPFLGNFETNMAQLGGKDLEFLMQRYDIECIPLQLMRGSSFVDAYIICDEIQILDRHEMLTLGTRVGENSKLVLLGDLNQRDRKITKTNTGLYQFVNSDLAKESSLVSFIELLKIERGPVAALFADIFEEE